MSKRAIPVLVGFGVAAQREEDPRRAREPLALMLDAVRQAEADAGIRGLLRTVQRIAVPKGRWNYANPAGAIGREIGAARPATVLATVGVLQQTLIGDTCERIAAGEIDSALVVGGDAGYRLLRAGIAGIECVDSQQDDVPDVCLAPHDELRHPAELRVGLRMPVGLYAILESAWRRARGISIDAHRDALATLYARLSAIAGENPHAWDRRPHTAEVIRGGSAANPMQAFPYTRMHCSSWSVDQAAALLFCSTDKARAMGVPESKWIYPLASSESNHMVQVSRRAELASCPGARIAGRAALEAAGVRAQDIDLVDLYSCFPIAIEAYAQALGLPLSRDLSVTGGMAFAGGPYNNFVLQAVCRMAELMRAGKGRTGLVTASSGVLTKQGFGVWSSAPGRNGFSFRDETDAVARATEIKEVVVEYEGSGVVAGYTVLHERGKAARGIVLVDTDGGCRTLAFTEDSVSVVRMESEEICGATVRISRDATFRLGAAA